MTQGTKNWKNLMQGIVVAAVITVLITAGFASALNNQKSKGASMDVSSDEVIKKVSLSEDKSPTPESKENTYNPQSYYPEEFSNPTRNSSYEPGELLVKFTQDVVSTALKTSGKGFVKTGLASVDALNERYGVTAFKEILLQSNQQSKVYKCLFSPEIDVLSMAQEYEINSYVEYAEPNYIYRTSDIPNDPSFNQQWGLHNTGQTGGTPDADIDAPEAWDIETGNSDVVIAVIDTGVDYTHPDLAGNIWKNTDEIPNNGIDDDGNGYIDDVHGVSIIPPTDIDPYGEPASYQRYGLWKDETETWHFRFITSGLNKRYSGTITTDDTLCNVIPVNLMENEYTITNHNISFGVMKEPMETGFDFQFTGAVLNFDLSFATKLLHGWLFEVSPSLSVGQLMTIVNCPFTFRFTNTPIDDFGHGTHCSGIIAAIGNNGIGIAGVSWNCKIMAVKALDSRGSGSVDDLANAVYYAVDNGADVISMSWGGYFSSQILKEALEYADDHDVVLVAAAGNDNTWEKMYPAAYDMVIAVAATDHNDIKAEFSNYGYWVDVAAPGVDIYSTMPTYGTALNAYPYGYEENYASLSGTSMACPYVAGLSALLLSKNLCFNPHDMVKTIISNTTDPVDTSVYIGTGRINAFEAIQRTPAIAQVDKTLDETDVNGSIDITGSAWGESFCYYVIECGRGSDLDSWSELLNSSSPVSSGLLVSLDTTLLAEGRYTLRLRVVCSDGVYADTIWVVVHNFCNTFVVDDDGGPGVDYLRIQDAVNDTGDGDTVYVHSGLYSENVVIDRTIDLIGEERNTTIIDANSVVPLYSYPGVVILNSDGISLRGFTIQHGGYAGVWVNSNGNLISGNIIQNNTKGINIGYVGWRLFGFSHNTIVGNILTNCGTSVYLFSSSYNTISSNLITAFGCGAYLFLSDFNTLSQNTILDTRDGIYLMASSYNHVTGNTIADDALVPHSLTQGIMVVVDNLYFGVTSSYNVISENTVKNKCNGIRLSGFGEYWVSENRIYHNNLIDDSAYDDGAGIWDNGYHSGGNFWSDYIGVDQCNGPAQNISGSDGIGDTPYLIFGGTTQDSYPLMFQLILGDVNNDGFVNWRDIDPFVAAMNTQVTEFQAQHPTWNWRAADCNQDGYVNWRDIGPFVTLLSG